MDVEHTFINHACICVKKKYNTHTSEWEWERNFVIDEINIFGVCNIIINSNFGCKKINTRIKKEKKERPRNKNIYKYNATITVVVVST